MKIIKLTAENIKNLKAVEIRPDGDTVVLTGKNGAGKSAVLDSIYMALTGKKVEEPIRRGEKRAEVTVDLEKYIVRKVWTEKGDRLEVKSADGALYPSPQSLLNIIIGKISFDPLEFMELPQEKQRDLILELAGVNLAKFRAKRQEVFDERTSVNRSVNKLEGTLSTMEKPPGGATGEVVSTSEVITEIDGLTEKRKAYEQAVAEKERRDERISIIKDMMETLVAELEELESKDIPIPEEVTDDELLKAKAKLAAAEENNKTAYEVKKYREAEADLEGFRKESENLTETLKELDDLKDQKIRSIELPLEGLAVTDDMVTYKDVPIGQLSTGEQIRVSTAIAMAMNPELRVIFIQAGSLLDDGGLKEISRLAKDGGYQTWVEVVDDSGEVGVFIEDGRVEAVNGVKKEENNDSDSEGKP